jgi:hypothetical protein
MAGGATASAATANVATATTIGNARILTPTPRVYQLARHRPRRRPIRRREDCVSPRITPISRPFTYEEYQWAGLPYCHLLPFTEAHQWQVEVRMPDLMSPDFDEWCDYVARDECARLRDDPKLIGYFYCDCPQWVHTSPATEWRGSLVDPALLATKMRQWADFAKRPVLLADAAGHIRAPGDTGWPPTADRQHDADHYRRTMDALWQIPQSVGYHLCGAHIRNNARRYGFRDRTNAVIPETVEAFEA